MGLHVLANGVDSLYLSFRGRPEPELLDALEAIRTEAQEKSQDVPITFENRRDAVMRPFGWGFYRYWAHTSDFDVFVGRSAHTPPAYVRIASQFLHAVGPEAAVDSTTEFVGSSLFRPEAPAGVSRVDLYADFEGWAPVAADMERFVTRSVRKDAFHESIVGSNAGRRFTGFRFGRDALVGRIYDKSLEITSSGKDWMLDIWAPRRRTDQPVWRLEFQFRRSAIADFNLGGVDEVLGARQDLWRYGLEWLSLRTPTPDRDRDRWPLADEWGVLQRVNLGPPIAGLVRRRIRDRQEMTLIRGLGGYMTSLAALHRVPDEDRAFAIARTKLAAYLTGRGTSFGRVVAEKRLRVV